MVYKYKGSRKRNFISHRIRPILFIFQANCSRLLLFSLFVKVLLSPTRLFSAKSLSDAFHQFVHDNKTEFPNEVNILERFNIYQEIVLGIIYRICQPSLRPILWYAYSGKFSRFSIGLKPEINIYVYIYQGPKNTKKIFQVFNLQILYSFSLYYQ